MGLSPTIEVKFHPIALDFEMNCFKEYDHSDTFQPVKKILAGMTAEQKAFLGDNRLRNDLKNLAGLKVTCIYQEK